MNNLENNYYAKWITTEELVKNKKILEIGLQDNIQTMGLPIGSNGDKIVVDTSLDSTLVIAGAGSGKTQCSILPMLYQAANSGESVLITDKTKELYQTTASLYKNNGYNVININLNNTNIGNCINIFELPKKLYDNKKYDEAYYITKKIFSYILKEESKNVDPFWSNTASDYITGVTMSLYDKNIPLSQINFKTISKFSSEYNSEEVINYLESIEKDSIAYKNICGTFLAPSETKASIISVLNEKLSTIYSKENLVALLSKSDFDIENIRDEKTILYISYDESDLLQSALFDIIFEEVYFIVNSKKGEKVFNFIIDNMDYNVKPIDNLTSIINNCRNNYIRFIMYISGFDTLSRIYGESNVETLKYEFSNILYYISNELNTIKFISEYCGKKSETSYLVSSEMLRRMPMFSSILLKSRVMPYYCTQVPFYEMNINIEKANLIENNLPNVDVINL